MDPCIVQTAEDVRGAVHHAHKLTGPLHDGHHAHTSKSASVAALAGTLPCM